MTLISIQERQLDAGYPKCKNPQGQTKTCDGKCGLEEFFKTPITLSPGFDFEEEIKKRNIREAGKKSRSLWNKTVEGLKSIKSSASEYGSNIKLSNISTQDALNVFYNAASDIYPLLNQLPTSCLLNAMNDGKNIICSVSRQAQKTSSIDDFKSAAAHKWEMTKILAKNAGETALGQITKPLGALKSVGKDMLAAKDQLMSNTTLYSLCERRFKDHIQDTIGGKLASISDGLKSAYQESLLGTVNKVLDSCFAKGQRDMVINNLNALTESEKREFNNIVAKGNLTDLNNFIGKNKTLAQKFGNGDMGFNFSEFQRAAAFDPNLLISTKVEFAKKLNPLNVIEGFKSQLTDPQFLINSAMAVVKNKNLLSTNVADNFKMGENIMASFGSQGKNVLEAAKGELPNLSKSIGGKESKEEISDDIIQSIQSYIAEKNKVYTKLNSGNSLLKNDK